MAGGALDSIVARVEAYLGEFLQSRAGLLDAKSKLDSAISMAQRDGVAKIGTATFTLAQLNTLYAENADLLAKNADLQLQIADFKDKVAMVQQGAENVMDIFTPGSEDFNYNLMGNSVGAIPVMIPAAALVAAGAVLATTIYIFLGNAKKHIAAVAGAVVGFGSDVLLLAVAGFAAYWYFIKRGK
jgi:hypothetical protein